ncbi:hypothetical protein NPIL_416641 [Nephila pilipes]|uniref:Uncharacterized protein n=1 Tax=Nephila pilipes TaxID=299642 RepID=A0A8X6P224_NEPPI|nr:hypothetical protein NPIL_416641 [Nephila pilipes]
MSGNSFCSTTRIPGINESGYLGGLAMFDIKSPRKKDRASTSCHGYFYFKGRKRVSTVTKKPSEHCVNGTRMHVECQIAFGPQRLRKGSKIKR